MVYTVNIQVWGQWSVEMTECGYHHDPNLYSATL